PPGASLTARGYACAQGDGIEAAGSDRVTILRSPDVRIELAEAPHVRPERQPEPESREQEPGLQDTSLAQATRRGPDRERQRDDPSRAPDPPRQEQVLEQRDLGEAT